MSPLARRWGWAPPFHDEAVGHFGLRNAVMALGDTFVGSSPQCATARQPAGTSTASAAMAATWSCSTTWPVRAVRTAASASARSSRSATDILDIHLHPRDVGGAIVALGAPVPPGSWRWGGPGLGERVPEHGPEAITGATIAAADPEAMAARWAEVLGGAAGGTAVELDGGGGIEFVAAHEGPGG